MAMPWTRLEGTHLHQAAVAQYRANGHAYHGMNHIAQLYRHAERLGLPYDLHLDRAILAHDVILDGGGECEKRSADWLDTQMGFPDTKARALIMTTVDHDPAHGDQRLALLDLMDFADPLRRRINTRLLRDEALRAQGEAFDQPGWVMNTLQYLHGLQRRILAGIVAAPQDAMGRYTDQHAQMWSRIARGIATTMETMPHDYARHPASGIRRFTRETESALFHLADSEGPVTAAHQHPSRVFDALVRQGLVRRYRHDHARAHSLTAEGQDWVERMRTPHPPWPEPLYGVNHVLLRKSLTEADRPDTEHEDITPRDYDHVVAWYHVGDADLARGGLFYDISGFDPEKPVAAMEGFSRIVEVIPSTADPDSWIIRHDGQILINPHEIDDALATCSYKRVDNAVMDCAGGVFTGDAARCIIVEAFHASAGQTQTCEILVTRDDLAARKCDLTDYVHQDFLGSPPALVISDTSPETLEKMIWDLSERLDLLQDELNRKDQRDVLQFSVKTPNAVVHKSIKRDDPAWDEHLTQWEKVIRTAIHETQRLLTDIAARREIRRDQAPSP